MEKDEEEAEKDPSRATVSGPCDANNGSSETSEHGPELPACPGDQSGKQCCEKQTGAPVKKGQHVSF